MTGEAPASETKPSAETTSGADRNGSGNNKADDFAVKVKPEFVLTERSPILTPDKPVNAVTPVSSDNGSGSGNGNDRRNNKKSRRGQNKKRPRDAKIAQEDKVCLAVVRGEECPFGAEKCKYNHDLKEILANRPEDIDGIDGYLKEEGCPAWRLRGYCDFGVMCRLGSCHINMSTGQNLRKSVDGSENDAAKDDDVGAEKSNTTQPKVQLAVGHQNDIKNVISRDTMVKLRKNTYPFVCKRHFEVAKEKQKEKEKAKEKDGNEEMLKTDDAKKVDSVGDATTPALPLKERKLIDFRNKVYVAPLTTVGNLPFRRIMKQFGADITCGEMALADQLLQGKASEWALLKRHPSEDVFGVQIAAGHADQYTRIAEVLTNEEGFEIDFVDMNLGCPIDLVCEKGAGASLMLREKKLRGSVEGLTKVLNCPVTIKMRTGWDEKKNFAHNLVPNIQKWGIEGIGAFMIHGRSRLQRYSRLADWDYIAQVASSQSSDYPKIPVIGNGDIFSYTDYEETILKRVGEEGDCASMLLPTAMLGRGALIKPWLPTEIKERRHWDISATERLDMLKNFVRFGLEHYGSDQQGVNNTRRFLLEWLSFLHRYVPVGILEVLPQQMNHRPPQNMCGRNDLETLMLSKNCADWIKISEMLLGPVPEGFQFVPKHKANSY